MLMLDLPTVLVFASGLRALQPLPSLSHQKWLNAETSVLVIIDCNLHYMEGLFAPPQGTCSGGLVRDVDQYCCGSAGKLGLS